jgi:hypothetical protein
VIAAKDQTPFPIFIRDKAYSTKVYTNEDFSEELAIHIYTIIDFRLSSLFN